MVQDPLSQFFHDSVRPCSPDRTTRSMEAHHHQEKRFCITLGSRFSAGSPFMVGMRSLEPDCERDPGSTQGRTKSSTHCLSELTMLLEFSDGRTSSTSVLLMTYTSTGNLSSCFFYSGGLMSICSYSFWRRSNYFLSS